MTVSDIDAIAEYLVATGDSLRSPQQWKDALRWASDSSPPNLGFQLRRDDGIVAGVFLATYGDTRDGHTVCHLGSWHVQEPYRLQSLLLFRALLAQDVDVFTDYSPFPQVRPINRRFGFDDMDTRALSIWNLRPPALRRGVRIITDPERIAATLRGRDARVFRDHQGIPGIAQLVVVDGAKTSHIVHRASPGRLSRARLLHVSDIPVFRASLSRVLWHVLLRHRSLFTVAELRTIGGPVPWARAAPSVPRQFKSAHVPESELDELYSPLIWAR
ncbi:hypothetical protein GCM10009739_07020 [Microbacterium ulmi]